MASPRRRTTENNAPAVPSSLARARTANLSVPALARADYAAVVFGSYVRATARLAAAVVIAGCSSSHEPDATDAPATTTDVAVDATTDATTGDDTGGSSSETGEPHGVKCREDWVSGEIVECGPDEVCIEDFGGDYCVEGSGTCTPRPEDCTGDDLCAPACAGLCDNYNCPVPLPEFCDSENSYTCDYHCWSQAACGVPGTSCKAIAHQPSQWFTRHCVPTADPPAQIGEPCTLQGDGEWLWDTCGPGALCWPIDPVTMQGTCRPECGLGDSVACDNCLELAGNEWLPPVAVCVAGCDLLAPDCPAGEGCAPSEQLSDPFVCLPDVDGDGGQVFDSCETSAQCDPGLVCIDGEFAASDCDPLATGCCQPFCLVTQPQCPGDTTCAPFFEPGQAPQGFEDLGVCLVPAP
jgi:hypothetical protein